MSTGPREGDSSFSWPPSSTDLAAIDVMEFAGAVTPGDESNPAAPPAVEPAAHGSRPAALPSQVHVRRRHATFAPAALGVATARPRRTRADHLVLLGLGVLVGGAMPDLGDILSFSPRDGIVAHARSASSPEAAQLLAMRALLRGETTASLLEHAVPDNGTEPRLVPATAAAAFPGDTAASAESAGSEADPESPPHMRSAHADSREAVATPATTTDAAAATPAPAGAAAASDAVRPRQVPRPPDPYTAPVRRAVRSFEAAWTRMDSSATRAVWPTANAGVLTRTFTELREQRLRLAPCRIERSGARARAVCDGTLRYRPRVGDHSTRVRREKWEFELEQTGRGRWVIRRVETG